MHHEQLIHLLYATGPLALKYVFDAFIGALEAPDATSSKRYRFWFRFLNLLAANIERSKIASTQGRADATAAGK